MKKNIVLAIACALLLGVSSVTPLCAQERGNWSMTVGTDVASHYLWRGMELGGPSIQPSAYFDYEKGDWAVCLGWWGTMTVFGDSYNEHDFFVEASWKNLTLSLTDYGYDQYFGPWKEWHDLDLGLSYTLSENIPVTFSWSSILNQPGIPSYLEASYDFSLSVVDFTVAAGMLPFTSDYYGNEGFSICNLNLTAGHEFEFEHGGSLPVSAQVMYNPMWNDLFWGVSVGYYFSLEF